MAAAKMTLTSEYLAGRTTENLKRQLEARLLDIRYGKLWYADVVDRIFAELEKRA